MRSNRYGAVFFQAALLTLPAAAGVARADDASCKVVASAQDRLQKTPNHQYITQTNPAVSKEPLKRESIDTASHYYVKDDGVWHESAITPSEFNATAAEAPQSHLKPNCVHVRDEAVEGEQTAVYRQEQQNDTVKITTLYWISKSRGLPLREEMDLDVGGASGKSHTSLRFSYTAIEPPAGLK